VSGKTVYTCAYCGSDVEKYPSQVTDGNQFCDSDCYGSYKSENINGENLPWYKGATKKFTCDNCGCEFQSLQSQRDVKETEHVFCDHDCYGEFERTESDRPYYGPKWEKQRQKALKESDEVCSYDGCDRTESQSGRDLDLHHIVPISEFDDFEKANAPENLVPVCAEHHARLEE